MSWQARPGTSRLVYWGNRTDEKLVIFVQPGPIHSSIGTRVRPSQPSVRTALPLVCHRRPGSRSVWLRPGACPLITTDDFVCTSPSLDTQFFHPGQSGQAQEVSWRWPVCGTGQAGQDAVRWSQAISSVVDLSGVAPAGRHVRAPPGGADIIVAHRGKKQRPPCWPANWGRIRHSGVAETLHAV